MHQATRVGLALIAMTGAAAAAPCLPSGTQWTRRDLKGKVVVLSAWATWCGPCQKEPPEVKALFGKLEAIEAAR